MDVVAHPAATWTIADIGEAIRARRVSAVAVARATLERIERLDPHLRAFVAVDAEGALRQAATLDDELAAGRCRGPLHGVPLAWKDLYFVGGLPNTCGTGRPMYYAADHDATVVTRLVAAGAVGVGKLTMTELAMGTFGDNPARGTPRNPWNASRVPGGSSSGSAVAVAARLVPAALGTDTGGSIRIPAACCGVVGLKPTYGRVSLAGLMPLSPTLDHAGPMARTVRDIALLLSIMAGHDPRDPRSRLEPVPDYTGDLGERLHGITIGVPEDDELEGLDSEVAAALTEVARLLATHGATVKSLRLPDPRRLMEATTTIVRREAAVEHAGGLAEPPADLQPFTRARLKIGAGIADVVYREARSVCAREREAILRSVFGRVDAVMGPIVPEPAPVLADAVAGPLPDMMERMARFSRFARLWNGLGVPVLAMPCGFSTGGLPLAFQLSARPLEEAMLLRVGAAYEAATEWSRRLPPILGGAV